MTSKDRAILKMRAVNFKYPTAETRILNDVNVQVSLNSRVAVLGPNGAGKRCAWAAAALVGVLWRRAVCSCLVFAAACWCLLGASLLLRGRLSCPPVFTPAAHPACPCAAPLLLCSTMIKLLTGELEAESGLVWKHPNLRVAYVAQHAFHHIENHLDMTPNQYIQWRYATGEDRESLDKVSRKVSGWGATEGAG